METEIAPDARVAVWEKFVMQAPHATMTSVCQMPCGPIRETPEGDALYRALIAECIAVGRASGVALPDDAEETAMGVVWQFLYEQKTSMSIDYERGNRVELEQLTGAVVRRGEALGVPTPTFDVLYGVLKVRAIASGGLPKFPLYCVWKTRSKGVRHGNAHGSDNRGPVQRPEGQRHVRTRQRRVGAYVTHGIRAWPRLVPDLCRPS